MVSPPMAARGCEAAGIPRASHVRCRRSLEARRSDEGSSRHRKSAPCSQPRLWKAVAESACWAALAALVVCLLAPGASAQDYVLQIGSPAFATPQALDTGQVDAANGDFSLSIPLISLPQRGNGSFTAQYAYDSRIWQIVTSGGSSSWQPANVPGSWGGWRPVTSAGPGTVSSTAKNVYCTDAGQQYLQEIDYSNFVWSESDGTQHFFPISTAQPEDTTHCSPSNVASGSAYATDSSGRFMAVSNYNSATVYAPDGAQLYPSFKDANGNYFSIDANGNPVDTLGRTAVTTQGGGSYAVPNAQGGTSTYAVTIEGITVTTAFGVSGVSEYSGYLTVVKSVVLPDGSQYSFGYDTYGELDSVQLPTGATATCSYTNFTDALGETNRWLQACQLSGGRWTFTPSVQSTCSQQSTSCQQQMTLRKATGDSVVWSFTIDNGAWNTQTQYYNGEVNPQDLAETDTTEWNFSNPCQTSGCAGNQYVQRTLEATSYPVPGGSAGKTTEWTYDSINDANATKIQEWNFPSTSPSGNPTRETDISYVTTPGYVDAHIIDLPSSVTLQAGGATLSQTNTTYDSTALTSIAGGHQS